MLVYCRNGTVGWTDDDADLLRIQIVKFKERVMEVFAEYQFYVMRTLKWHLLNNLVGERKRSGGI